MDYNKKYKFYCDSSYCYAVKGGKMLYADDDHISIDGSKIQAKYLVEHNILCGK